MAPDAGGHDRGGGSGGGHGSLPMTGERIATAILALGNGLALEGLLGDDEADLLDLVTARLLS